MNDRKRLREMGVPEDMSADDVKALFSLPDDDDRMHQQGVSMSETILERSEKPDGTIVDLVRLADGSEIKREYSYICSICGAVDNEHPFPRSAISYMRRGCKA